MTTVGDVDDFRHFLPRILELLPEGKFETDIEVVLGKLSYGGWHDWPVREQQAIQDYLFAIWCLALSSPTDPSPYYAPDVERWLSSVARVEISVEPYLEIWLKNDSSSSTANLIHFVKYYSSELLNDLVPPGYWENSIPQWRQVASWLIGVPVRAKIARAAESHSDSVLAIQAEEAQAVLSRIKMHSNKSNH